MKIFKHIFPAIIALILFSSCSNSEEKLISRRDLAEIYAEMLLTDQWIALRPELRRQADTSLVYEPILNKYGYTTKDYIYTMDKYMDDTERYSRILRSTVEILEKKLKKLENKKSEIKRQEEIDRRLERIRKEVSRYIEYKIYYQDTTYNDIKFAPDSLTVEPDSNYIYCLNLIFELDSLIDGPRLVQTDTVVVVETMKKN